MEDSIAYLKDFIEGRIEILNEEHPANNRQKCFHEGQISAFEEVLDEIEEMAEV